MGLKKAILLFIGGFVAIAWLKSPEKPSPVLPLPTPIFQVPAIPAPATAVAVTPAPVTVARSPIPPAHIQAPSISIQPKAEESKPVYVSGNRVALRKAPDAKSEVLDRLNDGFSLEQIERKTDWVHVRHPLTRVEGYVASARLRDTPPVKKEEEVKSPSKKETAVVLTAAAITAILIAESVASYRASRPCACPYNETRTGASCGSRSAWSRPGGASPLCYASDITPEMIAGYRARGR